jgi:RND family efflux transporter MFP subunit
MNLETRHHEAVALACIAAFVGLAGCGPHTAEEVTSESAVTVAATPAATGTIRGVIHATGVVSPAPGAELVVVAPETARVVEIRRAGGDRVRKGDVLVRFEIPSSTAEVARQQAEVTRAQVALDNARSAQTRARELFDRGVAARRDLEDSTRAEAEAVAALAQARASLEAAQTVARRATVHATFDGIVAKRLHNPGDLVEPTAADPVLDVIDPRRLEVVASVPLADAARIEIGAPGHLVDAPGNGRNDISLRVLSRPVSVEAGTATVPVRLSIAADANVPAGTPVQVDIEAEEHSGVVLVPAVALVREGDETAVFVASGQNAHRRSVQVGLTDGERVEIVSGITPGEMVIVDGQAGLPNGALITVTSAEGTATAAGKGEHK